MIISGFEGIEVQFAWRVYSERMPPGKTVILRGWKDTPEARFMGIFALHFDWN
jgi:hypothetical protein